MESNAHLDPYLISMTLGVLIPLVTGVITKLEASAHIKAITALVLSALVGTLTQIQQKGGTFDVKWAATLTATAFVSNLGSYTGLWKPTGPSDAIPFEQKFADFGFGEKAPPPAE